MEEKKIMELSPDPKSCGICKFANDCDIFNFSITIKDIEAKHKIFELFPENCKHYDPIL